MISAVKTSDTLYNSIDIGPSGRWEVGTRSGTRAPKPPFCSRGESTGDAGAVRDEMTGEATGGLLEEDEAPPLPLFPEALPERGRCELPGEEHEVR